jgi:hypothetical protein
MPMKFKKYMHVERFGNKPVQGIELGVTHIFPKIDGTNGSIWLDDLGKITCGSRSRELSITSKDNFGFRGYVLAYKEYENYLQKHPDHRLYGEFLIPHTLKTYRDNAWRKFYIFDVAKYIDNEF